MTSAASSLVKILVVSDLHAVVGEESRKDSRLEFNGGESEFGNAFIGYAKELGYSYDILVCAGDITNKADSEGFERGWTFLNEVKKVLNIPHMVCVPGNHDHKSRMTEGVFDPKHHLQFIKPPFPFDSKESNTQFWAWHWCYSDFCLPWSNVLSINTSAYHGYGDKEHSHGRISSEVVGQIEEFILSENFPKRIFNLLVCHHHPEKMEYVDRGADYQAMEGGSLLLRSLQEANKGPWLIIHGHKHFAEIVYSRSSGLSGPTLFAAGSFSAQLYPSLENRTSNQFYIIDVNLTKTEEDGRLVGTFETHEWTLMNGWRPSVVKNLPARGGFGNSIPVKRMAREIANLIDENNPFLEENDLQAFADSLQFFTPQDFQILLEELTALGLEVCVERNLIVQVGRRYVK